MMQLDEIQKRLLAEVADLHEVPTGAYNFRANGQLAGRANTAHIEISSKADGTGIDIRIAPGTKNESVHIPVVVSAAGLKETVYNDFYVGEDSDVLIVAGCGIDNCGRRTPNTTACTAFTWAKTPESATWKSTTAPGAARASASSTPRRKFTWRTAAPWRWKWCKSKASIRPSA